VSAAVEALPGRGGSGSGRAFAGRLRQWLPAVVVAVAGIVVWELATAGPGRRILPPPSAILGALGEQSELFRRSTLATFNEALGGLVYGTLAGVLVAFATSRWATARGVLLPVAIASSAIPLIAIAPILNNWFGVLNPFSKQMMAALLVFFPVMINVTRGLVEVQPAALELMRSYASSEWGVLFRVRVPNMLPFFFTALKIGTTLAFIGAIVGEYFGGTSEVLGRVVLQSMSSGSFDAAWAGILLGAAGAIVSYLVVTVVERLVIPWYVSMVARSAA
jgi:NitT/TauT family transport system permease protein